MDGTGAAEAALPAATAEPAGIWTLEQPASAFPLPVEQEAEGRRTLALYLAAGVSYVGVGVFVTELMLSWVVGFGWLLLWVWLLPTLARRLRR